MTPEDAKAAVFAETCPCPCPEGHDPGARAALPPIPAFLAPLAAQFVAQYGPQIVAELTKAAQLGIDAFVAKLKTN